MRKVFKYTLFPDGECAMPAGAEVLTVAAQGDASAEGGHVMLWALVDPQAYLERRFFIIAGTGHGIGHDVGLGRFIGTAFLGPLVWHVWEEAEPHP